MNLRFQFFAFLVKLVIPCVTELRALHFNIKQLPRRRAGLGAVFFVQLGCAIESFVHRNDNSNVGILQHQVATSEQKLAWR